MIAFHIGEQRRFERRVSELVDAQSAEQRIRAHSRDQIDATADESGLRTAEKLIATVSHNVDARVQAVEHSRLAVNSDRTQIEERAATKIFHQRNIAATGESN